MSTKLFVGGVSWGTNEDTLNHAFGNFGRLVETKVIRDRETGRSRGFAFITFETPEQAKLAMERMDGQELDGRTIRVSTPNNE